MNVSEEGPLQGLLVVALEEAVAAPFCSSRLADAGARDVISPRYGLLCAGDTSTSSRTSRLIFSIGSASGSIGTTERSGIFGSTLSADMRSLRSGQEKQACSGECPVPTMSRHSC